jgi:hypothetical protein
LLAPFARHAPLAPGLLRSLRPTTRPTVGDEPARVPGLAGQGVGGLGWFPRPLHADQPGWAPNYAPAASPRLRRRPST